eukprot:TRINITY_DN3958_c0_g1_i1.p1 TRINITY_DN3958_c0_g1~~TRINITY_DN3958_c0_g1_i1.p1  ORF type:complete len:122 (+),score=12.68 TRINITY_DN3958_c0_g1_i1:149-514(+)
MTLLIRQNTPLAFTNLQLEKYRNWTQMIEDLNSQSVKNQEYTEKLETDYGKLRARHQILFKQLEREERSQQGKLDEFRVQHKQTVSDILKRQNEKVRSLEEDHGRKMLKMQEKHKYLFGPT